MKNLITFTLLCFICQQMYSQSLTTYFELSNFKRTPRYDSTIAYCKLLAKSSRFIQYQSIGTSHEGREIPLLIAANKNEFNPAQAHKSGKNIILIQACIHAGEPDGKDAGFLLFKDLITKPELKDLLEHNIILFIPILNVDGHERFGPFNRINQNGPIEMGWRCNARNLNLNRDYIKAQSIEIQHWLKLFHQWQPHFFIDCHTTDGADYQYPITYALEIYGNMDKEITEWQKNILLPLLEKDMNSSGYPIFRYVAFRNWYDFESGLSAWVTPPSLSQGYTALVNCPGLLIESHMLKDYKTRVLGTYEMLKHTLQILTKEKQQLQQLAYKIKQKKELTVAFKQTNDSVMVFFKGYEYTVQTSDLSGGKWITYSHTPRDYVLPMFETFVPYKVIAVPDYYVIPSSWSGFFKHYFDLHNIQYITINETKTIEAEFYRFKNVKLSSTSYEGCQRVNSYEIETFKQNFKLLKGSLFVSTNQPNYQILIHLIEPDAPASLFTFGFFNTIFEQKEYGEPYVLETLARKMLENDSIKQAFDNFRQKNPNATSYEILNWFYHQSPFADPWLNVYPVGKVFNHK